MFLTQPYKILSLFTSLLVIGSARMAFKNRCEAIQKETVYRTPPMWFKRVLAREVRLLLHTKAPVCLTVCMNLWPASTNLHNTVQFMTDSGLEMTIKPLCLWTRMFDWKVLVNLASNLLTPFFHAPESSVPQMCWRTCEGLIFVLSVDKAFNGPSVLPQDHW